MGDQLPLFDKSEIPYNWEKDWQDMPEFSQEDITPIHQIIVSFETYEDVKTFGELLNQKITYKTKSIWFPELDIEKPGNFIYTQEK